MKQRVRLFLCVTIEELVDCDNEPDAIKEGRIKFGKFLRTRYSLPVIQLRPTKSFSSPFLKDEVSPYMNDRIQND